MQMPKRVWSNKSLVYSNKKCVWKLGDKLGVCDPTFKEVESWKVYPSNRWENVSADDELQIYDSLNPTNIWTFEDWVVATYTFQDYDETVLKTGTVKDGWTPVAPTDPTREGYTFTWWNPEVWPIEKDTTYTATYEQNEQTEQNA